MDAGKCNGQRTVTQKMAWMTMIDGAEKCLLSSVEMRGKGLMVLHKRVHTQKHFKQKTWIWSKDKVEAR